MKFCNGNKSPFKKLSNNKNKQTRYGQKGQKGQGSGSGTYFGPSVGKQYLKK